MIILGSKSNENDDQKGKGDRLVVAGATESGEKRNEGESSNDKSITLALKSEDIAISDKNVSETIDIPMSD